MKRFLVIVLAVAAVGTFLAIRYYPFSNIIALGPRQTAADAPGEVTPQPDAPQRRQRLRPSPASEGPSSVVETPEPEPQEMTATTGPDEIADEELAAAKVTEEPELQEVAATTDEPDEVADEQLAAAPTADEPEPQETIATTEPDESARKPLAAAETTQEPGPRETAAATAPDESHRKVAATDAAETEPDKLARSPRGSTAVVGLPGATFQLGAGDRLGEVIFNRYAAMVRAKAGKVRYAAEQP